MLNTNTDVLSISVSNNAAEAVTQAVTTVIEKTAEAADAIVKEEGRR